MTTVNDFVVEIHTEELPPKSLLSLAQAFSNQIKERLQKQDLSFKEVAFFATPRRLAVYVNALASAQPDQWVERRGPLLSAAFDGHGKPTAACIGFARACGVMPDQLETINNAQGEWVGVRQHTPGKSVQTLLPIIVEQSLQALPIAKRMRWGKEEALFVRPVHRLLMLYGDQVVDASIFNCQANRLTRGHRFHAPDWINLDRAEDYETALEKGFVLADFAKRRERIISLANACVKRDVGQEAEIQLDEALLDEVTGLVEWPIALCGHFDEAFLTLPKEVLISSMQDHQRYFPVVNQAKQLLPHFITISNINSKDSDQVISGNERVLRARLSDAAFFYATDQTERLESRFNRLAGIIFQAKLGTLHDKAERMSCLSDFIAQQIGAETKEATRAARVAKTDLTTQMVGEFPELQGIMGYYYAKQEGESEAVAQAIREHYLPRFAGDALPETIIGQIVAVADRVDTLLGAFGINQIPTGDKDPYGLRRAALGIVRILIEKKVNLDLATLFEFAKARYTHPLENEHAVADALAFIQERLRTWYQENGISADVFAAVAAVGMTNPLDADARIKAVQAFKRLTEAETLSIANKRVSNILAKYEKVIEAKTVNPKLFEHKAEATLAACLENKREVVTRLYQARKYDEVLMQLADLKQPIDDFFNDVMVMAENQSQRENRLLLLTQLRALFLQVADIALLQ